MKPHSGPKNKPNSNPIQTQFLQKPVRIPSKGQKLGMNKVIANAHIIFLGQIISALTFLRDLICGCFFIRTRSLLVPILSHGLANAYYLVMAPVFM